jgi:hypothetical protein
VWWLTLTTQAETGDGVGQILPEIEALTEFATDLNRRLAAAGVDGVDGAREVYRRVEQVLHGISLADLERMREGIGVLERAMNELAGRLAAIRRLKELLGA